jgi:glycosyltransferase involved in cell wall biosynthesis
MAWNEVENLRDVVLELAEELQRLGKSHEILIIDDGSTDGTAEEADRLANGSLIIRVIHHRSNQGLGGVYRTGFTEAHGDWLTYFPADGQFPAAILGRYAVHMDEVDMVLGYLVGRERPLAGRFLSFSERILLNLLFGHFPHFQGILLFRRELLHQHTLVSQGRGWIVLMEFILRAIRHGARHRCVPIPLRPRRSGSSKVNNLRSIGSNLRQLITLRLHF